MLIAPAAVGLHKPFKEAVGHQQQGQTICLRGIVFMNRLVAHLTGGMQNLCQILCQQALVIEDFKILPGCVVGGEEESVIDKH